ncbi:MAG: hypothetical protein KF781_06880 [Chitinophagaceae bacterium]|nr:hypothetical protein [Chitinophagaceae bacterium]MCW5904054.1 hypothetical protein [Chitinophagaceae bacterium]
MQLIKLILNTIYFKKCAIILIVLLSTNSTYSQINEPTNHQAYEYLYRMAQKGIVNIDDYILPLDRATIYQLLDTVKTKVQLLNKVEKEELNFYLNDFLIDNTTHTEKIKALDKKYQNRPRLFYAVKDDKSIMIDPIFGFSAGKYYDKKATNYFGGIRVYGKLGKRIGFNFSYRDITETGDTVDIAKGFNALKGRAGGLYSGNKLNYGDFNFNIGYKWKNGMLSVGKENIVFGYAQSGNIILSDKAPSYPYIKLDYYPFKWLHFNYMHGWLMSNVIDSNATYGTGSGVYGSERLVYVPKFIAHHSITITPTKGLKISVGESMVYSDKFDIGYLIPINFFKGYDHYASNSDIRLGGNGQFFGQISSRNHIKNTHLYASLFIDEIRLSKIFSKHNNRNQLGYTIGGSITDVGVKYLTLGAEYVHINPFVYSNLIPAQLYTSHNYSLGDWMGNNADRLYAFAKYTPVAKLKTKAWFQYIRKGGAGTIQQQYIDPMPPFLFDKLFNQTEVGLSLQYEWIQSCRFNLLMAHTTTDFETGGSNKGLTLRLGISYGL